jgi:hypothetical protein
LVSMSCCKDLKMHASIPSTYLLLVQVKYLFVASYQVLPVAAYLSAIFTAGNQVLVLKVFVHGFSILGLNVYILPSPPQWGFPFHRALCIKTSQLSPYNCSFKANSCPCSERMYIHLQSPYKRGLVFWSPITSDVHVILTLFFLAQARPSPPANASNHRCHDGTNLTSCSLKMEHSPRLQSLFKQLRLPLDRRIPSSIFLRNPSYCSLHIEILSEKVLMLVVGHNRLYYKFLLSTLSFAQF